MVSNTEQCKAESAEGKNSRKMPGAAGSRIMEKTVSHYFVRISLHCIFLLKKKKKKENKGFE